MSVPHVPRTSGASWTTPAATPGEGRGEVSRGHSSPTCRRSSAAMAESAIQAKLLRHPNAERPGERIGGAVTRRMKGRIF